MFPAYLEDFVDFFRDPIYWSPILKGLLVFARLERRAHPVAYVLFRRKDVLS